MTIKINKIKETKIPMLMPWRRERHTTERRSVTSPPRSTSIPHLPPPNT